MVVAYILLALNRALAHIVCPSTSSLCLTRIHKTRCFSLQISLFFDNLPRKMLRCHKVFFSFCRSFLSRSFTIRRTTARGRLCLQPLFTTSWDFFWNLYSQVTDKQYEWAVLPPLVNRRKWTDIQELLTSTVSKYQLTIFIARSL